MGASAETDGKVLLTWLCLLGWQTEIERDGPVVVGVARHHTGGGKVLRVGGCATTEAELSLQLFESVMRTLEARRARLRSSLAA
jgi:hypothetical protein